MPKFYYDLHLHSCLSPCGDMDMTPNNIVNMAKLLGLDVIALTDHNTSLNCEAAMKVGEEVGVLVIPGMELTTSEDIHAVCLFPTLAKALAFSTYVDENRIHIRNKAQIYGRQVIMDENDEEIGEIEDLLIPASFIGIYDAYRKAKEFGGICYPAHIDRDSLSILAVQGEIDPYCGFRTAELANISRLDELKQQHPILETMNIITCSDAHYLENMKDAANTLELPELTREAVIAYLDS
ncbi:MAG: PHP domain-containing protein [Ruminococcus sp.]|uniref:PHP domain-containing protein n=1 Tax=Ruminococcus sp. TaxID=41978 RepID=UPI002873DA4A|nr:PHP domain-containing protein [Ruminococcus sp.]MBQ3285627.1 PHP domain-containing protein [Ruminococcus sp.]